METPPFSLFRDIHERKVERHIEFEGFYQKKKIIIMSTTLLPDPLLDSRLEKKTLLRSIFGISCMERY